MAVGGLMCSRAQVQYGDGRYVSRCYVLRLRGGRVSSRSKVVIGEPDSLAGQQCTTLNAY